MKLFDGNRLKKSYPLLRVKPVYKVLSDQDNIGIGAEVAIIDFVNSFSETYTFLESYSLLPAIALTPEEENVNIFISSLSLTEVVIESSAPFTGKVHIQVFEVKE